MKIILTSIFIVFFTLTACTNTDNSMSEHEKIADQLDPTRDQQTPRDPEFTDPELDSRLGYVNYTKDQFNRDPEKDHIITMDRNKMADMIARVILRNDGFEEVATLVTGKEVLIAYEKTEELDANNAAEIANKTAMSIMPSYFHIYVSDNDSLIQDTQSLHNSTTENNNYDNTIQGIIVEMKKSPQGNEE